MARRQNEAVSIGPIGLLGIEAQRFSKEDGGNVSHAHGHARMP